MFKWRALLSFVLTMCIATGLTACSNDDEEKEVTTEKIIKPAVVSIKPLSDVRVGNFIKKIN